MSDVRTIRDELFELEMERFKLINEIDAIKTDQLKPRKRQLGLIDKQILATITSESEDQVLMQFREQDNDLGSTE